MDRSKGGRPPFDAMLKFKMLYLQAQHGLSFEATEHLVRDRLSWMRFCGLTIADPVPDANTLVGFSRGADQARVRWTSSLPVSTRRSRMPAICRCRGRSSTRAWWQRPDSATREEEKAAIKAGRSAAEIWPDKPAKAAQKDTDARWTVKTSKGKVEADGTRQA